MADYTEEQRVKREYPAAKCRKYEGGYIVRVTGWVNSDTLGTGATKAEAWADASRRLGNEFVDEVGPLAERKEG